jgi:hypothetical protein
MLMKVYLYNLKSVCLAFQARTHSCGTPIKIAPFIRLTFSYSCSNDTAWRYNHSVWGGRKAASKIMIKLF